MEAIDKVGAESIKVMAGEIVKMQNIIEGKTTRCKNLERQLAEAKAELATYKGTEDVPSESVSAQEKINADKHKLYSTYWNCAGVCCDNCPSLIRGLKPREHFGVKNCVNAKYMDIHRRQMWLDDTTFDWDGFRNCKFVVNCRTEEAAKDFCYEMNKRGMKWCGGGSYIDDVEYGCHAYETCYTGRGTYESGEFYRAKGKRIVEWKIGMGDA